MLCKLRREAYPENLSAFDSHALEGRVGGDAGAEQRGDAREVRAGENLRHSDNKMTVHDDSAAVAAVGGVALVRCKKARDECVCVHDGCFVGQGE
jgi:hypothetical protein